jgi:pimeloyl-ACP methyl ester carboxylesterase
MSTLSLRDALVSYTDVGRGQPVILVHGSAANRRIWRALIERLADRYRVIAPDLPGYGESAARDGASAAVDVDAVLALARAVGEPFHLVGHSYGGAVALEAALDLEPRLRSLTVVEPVSFQLLRPDADAAALEEIEAVASRHLELVASGDLEACAEHFMRYWIGPAAWAAMPAELRCRIVATMPKVAAEFRFFFREARGADHFLHLRVPTLLVRGTRTTLAARRVVEVLGKLLPNARLAELHGAGHLAPVTHPALVEAAIEAHIARWTASLPAETAKAA